MNERHEMNYPEPERSPRRVFAGSYGIKVAEAGGLSSRVERRRIYIHTSGVQKHLLALELRSRVHTLEEAEGAAAS